MLLVAGGRRGVVYLCKSCVEGIAKEISLFPIGHLPLWIVRTFRKEEAKEIFTTSPVSSAKNEPLDPGLMLAFQKERLEALIQDERYEEAAKLAGEIRNLANTHVQNHALNQGSGI